MDSTSTASRAARSDLRSSLGVPTKRFSYALFFVPLGVATIAVCVSSMTRWVLSSDFARTPNGPDHFPTWNLAFLRFLELGGVLGGAGVVWWFVLKPVIRSRSLTFDGKLVIGSLFCWVYDPLVNYFNNVVAYNTHFVNMGSWSRHIPGFQTPNMNRFSEPILFIGSGYMWWLVGSMVLGCAMVSKLKERRPSMSTFGMWLAFGAAFTVVDLLVEFLFGVLAVWRYTGTTSYGMIFSGRPYQFPLVEPLFLAFWTVGLVMFRYYRDDRGRSFVEQGISELRIASWAKSLLSLLAIAGFLGTWQVVGYNVPFQGYALLAGRYAPQPSYIRAGTCGEGTEYACPNNAVPIPKRRSLHIRPDDPRLPDSVRREQVSP